MSAVKTVAWGVMILGTFAATVHADSISSGGSSDWVFFTATGRSSFRSSYASFIGMATTLSVPPAPAPAPAPAPPPPPAPAPAPASASTPAPAPLSAPVFAPINQVSSQPADALLNFGGSPYLEASSLTVGAPMPWYQSPAVTKFFGGGVPDSTQQNAFENKVLDVVQHTFALSNLYPTLTIDPNVTSNHTMSLVSGAGYGPNPNAIGITDVGHNGFGFVDKFSYASSMDELATAVGKNMAHELMHAFGVGNHPDTTGSFIDTGTASWGMLTSADSTFSPSAASLIAGTQFGRIGTDAGAGAQVIEGAQEIGAAAVPEPATWAAWGCTLVGLALYRRRRAA